MPDLDLDAFDPALIERWVGGWTRSRRVAPPARVNGAYRVELGQPGRTFEFVAADATSATIAAAAEAALRTRGQNRVTSSPRIRMPPRPRCEAADFPSRHRPSGS